ncbi:hypothetical protein [Anoxynatronum buryatiense]|uniref:Uncharacterized protein n=1 Tax=Anoxynatronum buryatiense TaxID=489973 RepID=A0AA45WY74_9CLOT|nr:hypothetical protein [Anoxynatronum buryatiense]SMP65786.1 hypothetical protein SAMN06296020_11330 [Anoxynatronum buryatiense]
MRKVQSLTPLLPVLLAAQLLLTGCTSSPANTPNDASRDAETANLQTTIEEQHVLIAALREEKEQLDSQVSFLENQLNQAASESLLMTALTLVELIANQDFEAVALYVDPDEGIRFSPYGYVNVSEDLVFLPQELETLLQDSTVYTWGGFDGSGHPIDKTFAQYYDRFIYDQHFASPHLIGNNTIVGTGNSLINLSEVYPAAEFVEFHFTGFDPDYGGIDWCSLRLVLEEQHGSWILRGIVHDQWTI